MTTPATERRHPQTQGLQALPGAAVLSLALDSQIAALSAVRPALPALERAALAAAQALSSGGKLAYVGAGSSGLMALADCLELSGTFGIAPDRTPMLFAGGATALLHMTGAVEDDLSLAGADFSRANLGAGDVALCISASGSTPYTLAVARLCKAAGTVVIGLAHAPGTPLLDLADIPVCLETGPEIVAGSTRLGAATAQKAALNLISVLVGLRLGHVHDGFMVNLVADNAKLVDRAARIVAALSGQPVARAHEALAATSGAVKPAVLVAAGAAPAKAQSLLTDSGGHLGPALEQLK
ncbi:N-acetylmuramic acid 6-phosphate etherase [Fuscibacter oryzae]|uniref:N-acetylmuramic acid 6-phosphate etherase n=1 Tax=Fuscibacter oryzae TaxID=2803939 RepID=A0A8J7MR22_9RHOB|nr:N-acetylmuramic acid 6-phosphate etherase [Fuscibacter oryzae]MBL4927314.1 N-acetylmuramic acid 6-phosphate etherase [Fuscibacter oryzae]